ncbi:MAG: enoyl-CoA hydratase-related protein [Myxococcota bacterium]|nr:enoyl-CoA hydratase-related protein [Myxococcota bacterium]
MSNATEATEPEVLTSVNADGVAEITLNRPDRMNAFTWRMGRLLNDALGRFNDDDDVRAIIVTGKGRAFCAGADLGRGGKTFDRGGRTGEASKPAQADAGPVQPEERLHPWNVRKPIIAAINGPAVGVGLTIPLQYDIRIVAKDAKLGFVFVNRGIIPELASTWILPRLFGTARASDLLLSGRIFRGEEAAEFGICNEAVDKEEVLPRAREIARHIAIHSAPVSVALTKKMIWDNLGQPEIARVQAREGPLFAWTGSQPDSREGVLAFLEKREPEWKMKISKDTPELPPID